MALDRIVFAPSKVILVSLLVRQQGVEMVRQLLRAPTQRVYHGARWQEGAQGSPGEQDRHSVQLERVEGLLCDVVGADVVLKGEVELVVPGHQVKAGVSLHCVRIPQPAILAASLSATGTINVHLEKVCLKGFSSLPDYPNPFCEPAYIPVPSTVGAAMGDKPDEVRILSFEC